MTSIVRKDISRPDGSAAGADRLPLPSSAEISVTSAALCAFFQGSLAAAQEAIDSTLAMQQDMMDLVTPVLMGQGPGQSGLSSEDMQAMVSALQSDDLIRQNYENVGRALAVLSRAAGEVQSLIAAGSETDPAASALRDGWAADLSDALLLDEMRQRFSRKLRT